MPNRPKPLSGHPPPLCAAAFAAWLIANGTVLAQQANVAAPPDPSGEWLVAKQVARIKIADCDGQMWGVVSWETQPGIDNKNPDPNLRSRPTLGMPILLGMTPSKTNKWEGQIYNSEDGHTYSASITLLDPSTLRVQGCFLGFLCGGENWTRVEQQDPPTTATTPRAPNKQPATRKTTGSKIEPADDVCSRALGSAGLSHERGLK